MRALQATSQDAAGFIRYAFHLLQSARVTQDSLWHIHNTSVVLTLHQKQALDRHACADAVPRTQSFMLAMQSISDMCIHVCIHCVTDACLLQVAQQSQQAAAACLAVLQLSMLPLAGDLASPPPSSALLTSPNAQIPR